MTVGDAGLPVPGTLRGHLLTLVRFVVGRTRTAETIRVDAVLAQQIVERGPAHVDIPRREGLCGRETRAPGPHDGGPSHGCKLANDAATVQRVRPSRAAVRRDAHQPPPVAPCTSRRWKIQNARPPRTSV